MHAVGCRSAKVSFDAWPTRIGSATMDILALVTARGGSKGLPRKNLLPLAGKPLIVWTIEAALNSEHLSRVLVSTDDEEIAQVSQQHGAEVPFLRPAELATDQASHISVVLHAISWLREHERSFPEYVMLLQPTSPLRGSADIDNAARIAMAEGAASVVSVCPTHHHPYLVKQITNDGTLKPFISSPLTYDRRQDLPPAYFVNGAIYLTQCDALMEQQTFYPEPTFPYVMPAKRSPQIDEPWDLWLTETIWGRVHELTSD